MHCLLTCKSYRLMGILKSCLNEDICASLVAQTVKNLPAMQETWVWSLGQDDSLEKEKAIHSSILAWRIPRTAQSTGSQRVGRNWVTHFHCNSKLPDFIKQKAFSIMPIFHNFLYRILIKFQWTYSCWTDQVFVVLTWIMFSCISRMIKFASVARLPLIKASWSNSAFVLRNKKRSN